MNDYGNSTNTGFFGNPLVQGTLAAGGFGILGGLANYFGGGAQRKRMAQLYNQGQGMLGQQNTFNPTSYASNAYTSTLPMYRDLGNRLNRQFGLDSGAAQGDLLRSMIEGRAGLQAQGQMAKAQFNQQDRAQNIQLLSLLGQLA